MVLEVLRYAVFGVFIFASGIAVGSWALQTRRINPFGRTAGLIRRTSDPILKPIERQLVTKGSNPQNAGWWLLGATVAGGIVTISVAGWVIGQFAMVSRTGGRGVLFLGGQVISWALMIRVVGSWFGAGRHNRLMRPIYLLTDWMIRPLSRIVPPMGMVDITPLIAWFLIQILMTQL